MLNNRQKAFADFYLQLGNAEEAALRAGYSKTYARAQSYKLLENIGIRKYLDDFIEKADADRIAKAEEVLETLTRILRRLEKETVVVTCKKRKSHYDAKGKKVIEETEEPVLVEVPTAVRDVNKAAELLGKRYGLFTEKVELESGSGIVIKVDYGDNPTGESNI